LKSSSGKHALRCLSTGLTPEFRGPPLFFRKKKLKLLLDLPIELVRSQMSNQTFIRLAAADQSPARIPDTRRATGQQRLVGDSAAVKMLRRDIELVANRACTVLIEGETGTGKEVVARAIHESGVRHRGPWVAVNCGAIPEPLLEAELFGHVRGAFTGAVQARAGKFEQANHGTIFLDEIAEMPISVQAKLLRVLQEREVERLGGNERVRLDVRVVAATNAGLAARVQKGLFREDLFYRLSVFPIGLPALRNRAEDVPLLSQHFLDKFCALEKCPPKSFDSGAISRLCSHRWPGNIRELENTVETAVIMSGERRVVTTGDLRLAEPLPAAAAAQPSIEIGRGVAFDYQRAVEDFEQQLLTQALAKVRGNKTAAAELLGLKRTTLAAKMRVLESRMPSLVA
jgi:DNA-binding NtrC family response regulator